jgi:hypothetical protein
MVLWLDVLIKLFLLVPAALAAAAGQEIFNMLGGMLLILRFEKSSRFLNLFYV